MRARHLARSVCLFFTVSVLLSGCESSRDDKPIVLSVVGRPTDVMQPLTNNQKPGGQIVLGATAQGLVSLDVNGEVIPALAQRWIVVDDGRSYIFRLHRARWSNDDRVDAREVAQLLHTRIRTVAALDPYGNMAAVKQVLAMTGDVIEIRLAQARPNFLVMLAQPQLAIARKAGGTGPYAKQPHRNYLILRPTNDPASMTSVKASEGGSERDQRYIHGERASKSIMRFVEGQSDLVLGGSIRDFPYVSLARVERRVVRLDPVQGLFGLTFSTEGSIANDAGMRLALAMAIDRSQLPRSFSISGWNMSDQIVPSQLNMARAPSQPPWARMPMDERRQQAAASITRWRSQHGEKAPEVRVAFPDGPGNRLIFLSLARDWQSIGVKAIRVERNADLTLIDEVAPYDSAFWYLGRISCKRKIHCDPAAQATLAQATTAASVEERGQLLADAEHMYVKHGGYIPLASPLRWSLVSPRLTGYTASVRGYHPLNRLIRPEP